MQIRLARHALAATALTALTVLAAAPAGTAHDVLEGTEPAAGATVTEVPDEMTFTFSDSVQEVGNKISLATTDGEVVAEGEPTTDGPTVTFDLPDDLAPGTYVATWRVVSSDGHPISGQSGFVLEGEGGNGAAPSPSASESTGDGADSSSPTASDAPQPEDEAGQDEATEASEEGSTGLPTALWVGLGLAAVALVGVGAAMALRR